MNPFPDNKILALPKFRAFADGNFTMAQVVQFFPDRVENIVGKRRKCCFPAFSSFPTMFYNSFYSRVVKTWDYFVRS